MINNNSQSTKVSNKCVNMNPLTNLKFTYFTVNLARAFDTIFKILASVSIKSAIGIALIIALIPAFIKDGIRNHIISTTISTPLTVYTTVCTFLAILYVIYLLVMMYRFLKLAFTHGDRLFQNGVLIVGDVIAACFLVIALNHVPKSDFELNSPFINQTVYTFIAFACLFLAARLIMQVVTKIAQNRFDELFYTKEFLSDKDDVKLSQFATNRQKQLNRLVQPQWHDRTRIHELTFTQLPLSEQLTTTFMVDLNKYPYNNIFDFRISPVMSEFKIASSQSVARPVADIEKES